MKSGMIDEELRKIYDENELAVDMEKGAARNDKDSLKTLPSWHESGSHGFDKDDIKIERIDRQKKRYFDKEKRPRGWRRINVATWVLLLS